MQPDNALAISAEAVGSERDVVIGAPSPTRDFTCLDCGLTVSVPHGRKPLRSTCGCGRLVEVTPATCTAFPPVPPEGHALASVIGPDALLRLIERRGGTSVHLGEASKPSKFLREKLGLDAKTMAALRSAFGKQRLKVPLLRPWRARIYRKQGLSYAAIALKLGVTDSAVGVYLRDAGLSRRPTPI